MKIVVAGGAGFLGNSLVKMNVSGSEWTILTRNPEKYTGSAKAVYWDGKTPEIAAKALENSDVLINFCGKSVDCRYNDHNKKLIFSSRLESTRALGLALGYLKKPPTVWLNSSSATIYRHAEDRAMTERNGEAGAGFSVDVCRQWEQEFFSHRIPGLRQVALRTAIVLGAEGGVMIPFRRLVKCGLGGAMGAGNQMFSWIHISDFARAVDFLIRNSAINGPVNMAAPHPVTNRQLMDALRKSMRIPVGLPLPEWLLEAGAAMIGTETELILKSRWVLPETLLGSGFRFEFPEILPALKSLTQT